MIAHPEMPTTRTDAARPPSPPAGPPRPRRTRRRLAYGAAIAAVVALGALALRADPVPVEVGTVERGPLRVTLETDGITRVVDRYTISAPISGQLERMALREGDRVAAGATVAVMTPPSIDARSEAQGRARVASAQASRAEAGSRLEQARAAYAQAERQAERRRELAEAGALSTEQMEQAELEVTLRERDMLAMLAATRAADAEVSAARAALLSSTSSGGGPALRVTAPAAGRVLRLPDRSGRVVAAGTPLLEIGDAEAIELVLDLLSTDAVAVRPGMRLLVTGWGGADTLSGRVLHVEPAAFTEVSALGVEEQRVRVIGELLRPPGSLGDGYRVEGVIVLDEARAPVKVASSALFQHEGGWGVFVVTGGRARLRAVQTGRRGEGEVEVLGGVEPGERVVRYPTDALSDGARVRATP